MISRHYHDATKHHFHRFAPSLGYLDWATQPDPFRRYAGAPLVELPRASVAAGVAYAALFEGGVPPRPVTLSSIGELLRCSMGLSAWKQYGASRWALRVNPSSGNLHPTEAYIVREGRVHHYAPREHSLEERCVLGERVAEDSDAFLVALTSIHWREAWKYGERAFRYCQHDAGHAIGALRIAAALLGWRLALLPRWSHEQMAALLGTSRDADYGDAEREEPECVAVVMPGDPSAWVERDPEPIARAAAEGAWHGTANQLSRERVAWPMIDEAAQATRHPGSGIWDPGSPGPSNLGSRIPDPGSRIPDPGSRIPDPGSRIPDPGSRIPDPGSRIPDAVTGPASQDARELIIQRRSALAFDARGTLSRDAFLAMLRRLRPPAPPWDAIDWPPQVHLGLFVHRVLDVTPGVYAYLRDPAVLSEWKAAMRPEFLWDEIEEGLFLLVPIECRRAANRVSCDQDIAEDGFFSLGMLARFDGALEEQGESMYRRLFWECGLIGQVLYLEAEAAGGRATGIGCFYDDPVHDVLGLTGHAWQSLYHFSMGMPVEDTRLTTEPGYEWERADPSA